jgi:hypothetical protein
MQGTIAVMMALSGLGCHHKSCDVEPVAACYSAACYATACYGGGYSGCYALSYAAPVAPVFETYPSMQGPVVVVGCYGGCYGSARYASACYASACYTERVYDSCYGGCYGGRKKHGLFACLFGGHGHKRRASYCPPPAPACYASACYGGGYGMPVYGDYTPAYVVSGPSYGSGQVISSGQWTTTPQGTTTIPAPAATAPAPAPAEATPPPPPVREEVPAEPAPAPVDAPAPADAPAEAPPPAPAPAP